MKRVMWFQSRLAAFLRNDEGQGLVEYALVIALVSIVAIVALRLLGKKANNTLNNAAGFLS
jgi:pilus assembly protein Flp/PilA